MSDTAHLEMKLHRLSDKIGTVRNDVLLLKRAIDSLSEVVKTIEESKPNG